MSGDLTTGAPIGDGVAGRRSVSSRADRLAKGALERGVLRVDAETGAIYKADGERAELLDKRMGYGRVRVWSRPYTLAMAHRVVWIAVHGLIPTGLQINHLNRIRWDNRIANLEVVAPTGNARHWTGAVYDAVGPYGNLDPQWLARLNSKPRPESFSPYARGRADSVIDRLIENDGQQAK